MVQFQQSLFTAKVSYHTVIGYSATTIFDRVTEAGNNEKRIKKTETAKQSKARHTHPPHTHTKQTLYGSIPRKLKGRICLSRHFAITQQRDLLALDISVLLARQTISACDTFLP